MKKQYLWIIAIFVMVSVAILYMAGVADSGIQSFVGTGFLSMDDCNKALLDKYPTPVALSCTNYYSYTPPQYAIKVELQYDNYRGDWGYSQAFAQLDGAIALSNEYDYCPTSSDNPLQKYGLGACKKISEPKTCEVCEVCSAPDPVKECVSVASKDLPKGVSLVRRIIYVFTG
jgi:hypothetical protein